MISDADKKKGKESLPPPRNLKLPKGSDVKNKEEITLNLIKHRLIYSAARTY